MASRSSATALACLALMAGACLTPPGPRPGSAASGSPRTATAAVAPSLGHFTRTSPELLAKLRLGWNLGNSLEVPTGETGWGNPPATPELFAAVAKAGFGLVRIPVTWTPHTGPAPTYTIDPSWFQRVREVVGFARSAGLYSIINLHHDGADGWKEVGWLSLKDGSGQATEENNAAVRARFVAVWTQIARYFADQGEELLFESMNEIHDGYGKPDPRYYAFINQLNQEFVSLVRASGGNNAKRHLIVPGYNTNINQTLEGFTPPTDPAKGRLILSVHYYDPYLFALMGKTHTWGRSSPGRDDWGQEDFVVAQLDKLKARYVDQGIPVIVGEYGAVYQDGYQDYQRYYVEYVTKAAVDRGIVPVYWDNGGRGSGENGFAIIDRQSNGVFRPKVVEALSRAARSNYLITDVVPPAGTPAAGLPARLSSRLSWTSSAPLIVPRSDASHDLVAVKDPTVVRYNDRWHVYASSVARGGVYGMVYTSFTDWSDAPKAPLYYMDRTRGFNTYVAAPQLFYFTPQKNWYLVFQSGPPMFSTANDPGDPTKWTPPAPFYAKTPPLIDQNGGWLDFWVICDAQLCHLFFSNDKGRWYKSETPIAKFPDGFSEPRVVMQDAEAGRLYEACNVYKINGTGKYLALIEAFDKSSSWRRYFRSWTADSLEGPWTVLHDDATSPFAGQQNVVFDGTAWSDDISHGEMVRAGYDETMAIDGSSLRYLYQGFAPSANTSDYNAIPWRLGLLTPR